MARDLDGLADVVVMTVKAALAPVLERLAVAEAKVAAFTSFEQSLTGLRDRVVAAETKAAVLPLPVLDDTLPSRLTALESKSAEFALGRAVEDLVRRMEALEQRPAVVPAVSADDVIGLRDRLTVIETKAAGFETRFTQPDPLASVLDKTERAIGELTKDLGAMRERIAVVEVRAQVPGPAGQDGKDGADGLGFEDMDVEFDGDRTITIKAERGTLKKAWPIVLPYLKQQGVYEDGKGYVKGDIVTWGGSQWHANEPTTSKPGEGSKAWTLVVKRGRDGKDGKDAVALPVVKVN